MHGVYHLGSLITHHLVSYECFLVQHDRRGFYTLLPWDEYYPRTETLHVLGMFCYIYCIKILSLRLLYRSNLYPQYEILIAIQNHLNDSKDN